LVFAALFASAGIASFGIARLLEQSGFEAKAAPAREPVPTPTDVSEPKRSEAASASSAGGGAAVEPPAEAAVGILGKAASDIEFEFVPKQSRQPLPSPARAPLPAPHSADRRSVSPSPDPAGQLAPRGEAAEAFGFLTIDTTPWSFVSMGGKPLGQTPLVGVKLPVGVHVLSLKSPDTGRETSYTVNIEPGKTVARRVGLE
jgi:serine/threonine-protein kinase